MNIEQSTSHTSHSTQYTYHTSGLTLSITPYTADAAHFTLNISQYTAHAAHFKVALDTAPPKAPVILDTNLREQLGTPLEVTSQ